MIKLCMTILTVLLAGSLWSASVYAQDYDSGKKGSITIQLDDLKTEKSNVVFTCYLVGNVDRDADLNVSWLWCRIWHRPRWI